MNKVILVSIIAFPVIILDYVTKRLIVEHVTHYESIRVLPFLRIVHVENKGAAFGLFASLGNHVFMAMSVLAILAILIYIFRAARGREIYALSLISGGAVGNLIDRIRNGKVIDFIDLHAGQWHWPAFNVADSALTIGIAIFIWSNLRSGKPGAKEA